MIFFIFFLYQLLALANGDRIKDKQRSRSSFVVDMEKKLAAENLLNELLSYHGATIRQVTLIFSFDIIFCIMFDSQ